LVEAYLATGEGKKAAMEFKKLIDLQGMLANCPLAALARLGVARANALQAKNSTGVDADAARVPPAGSSGLVLTPNPSSWTCRLQGRKPAYTSKWIASGLLTTCSVSR